MYSELLVEGMAPQLVDCPHCDRLYSANSLPIHVPKCLANPSRVAAIRQSSIERNKKEPKKPKRRSKSTGAAIPANTQIPRSGANRQEDEENRPRTHTIRDETVEKKKRPITKSKRPKTRDINAEEPQPEAQSGRICFVCGDRIPGDDLIDHEIDCEATWRTSRRDFSPNIRCRSPQRLRIPSVDGTVDVRRVDKWAAESARRCQRAQCGRCLAELRFGEVGQHQCTRFEPTVEFYF